MSELVTARVGGDPIGTLSHTTTRGDPLMQFRLAEADNRTRQLKRTIRSRRVIPVKTRLGIWQTCVLTGRRCSGILETRALNVAVGDGVTTVPQTNGIWQGSLDSPDLFGAIIARDLQAATDATPPQPPDEKGGPPLPVEPRQ